MARILLFQQNLLLRLSLWSVVSVFSGGILALLSPSSSFWAAFGGMNAAWGMVNLLIASLGLYGVMKKMRTGIVDETREKHRLQRLLVVNAGLDVIYIAVGVAMATAGKTPLWQGFGWGIILQGGFLFLFDTFYYYRGGKL
ncbi:MAG: DUF6992 family protein [Armatimonadota bacterium]